jgi:hypothetical protein
MNEQEGKTQELHNGISRFTLKFAEEEVNTTKVGIKRKQELLHFEILRLEEFVFVGQAK